MNSLQRIFSFVLFALLSACEQPLSEEEVKTIGLKGCKTAAPFISKYGFKPSRTAFSTTEKRMKGLVLIELPSNTADTSRRVWQHESWNQYGYFGAIANDDLGNIYVAPIPFVNTLDHSLATIHTIYKVDAHSAEMTPYFVLPTIDSVAGVVPFAVMGLFFDCQARVLYVSSVAGSTSDYENGCIYALDLQQKKIIDTYKGFDPFGVFVGGASGQKKLYVGHARTSSVYSIPLTSSGKFSGKKKMEFSLDGYGPRGMDKARKIRYNASGDLIVYGLDFSFNLAAQSDIPETIYQWTFDSQVNKWVYINN